MTTTSTPRSTRPTALVSGPSPRTRSRLAAGTLVAPVFRRAAGLAATDCERDFLQRRADAAGRRPG